MRIITTSLTAILIAGALSVTAFGQGPTVEGYSETGIAPVPSGTQTGPPPAVGVVSTPPVTGAVAGVEEESAPGAVAGVQRQSAPGGVAGDQDEARPAPVTLESDRAETLPFTGMELGLIAFGGLALLAIGLVLRRSARSPLSGNAT